MIEFLIGAALLLAASYGLMRLFFILTCHPGQRWKDDAW